MLAEDLEKQNKGAVRNTDGPPAAVSTADTVKNRNTGANSVSPESKHLLAASNLNPWNNKLLQFDVDTYLVPCRSKVLFKRLNKVSMEDSLASFQYTQLVWIMTKGLP